MATQLKLRRGTTAEHASFTGAEGEITLDTTKDTIVVHDNYTAGGRSLLREDLNNLANGAVTAAKISHGTAIAHQAMQVNAAGNGVEFQYPGSIVSYGYSEGGVINTTSTSWVDLVTTNNVTLTPGTYEIAFYSCGRINDNNNGGNIRIRYSTDAGSNWTNWQEWYHREYGPSSANQYPAFTEYRAYTVTSNTQMMWRAQVASYTSGQVQWRYNSGTTGTCHLKVTRVAG